MNDNKENKNGKNEILEIKNETDSRTNYNTSLGDQNRKDAIAQCLKKWSDRVWFYDPSDGPDFHIADLTNMKNVLLSFQKSDTSIPSDASNWSYVQIAEWFAREYVIGGSGYAEFISDLKSLIK